MVNQDMLLTILFDGYLSWKQILYSKLVCKEWRDLINQHFYLYFQNSSKRLNGPNSEELKIHHSIDYQRAMPFIVFLSQCKNLIDEGLMIPGFEFSFYKCKPEMNQNDKIFHLSNWILQDIVKRDIIKIGKLWQNADYLLSWQQERDEDGYSNFFTLSIPSVKYQYCGFERKTVNPDSFIQQLEENFFYNEHCKELLSKPSDETVYEHVTLRYLFTYSFTDLGFTAGNSKSMKSKPTISTQWIRDLVLKCHECGILHNQYLLQLMLNFLYRVPNHVHDLHRLTFYDSIQECCPYSLNFTEILSSFENKTKIQDENTATTTYRSYMKMEKSFHSQISGDEIESYIISLTVDSSNVENPFSVSVFKFYQYCASVCYDD